jgi:hypothetical protein
MKKETNMLIEETISEDTALVNAIIESEPSDVMSVEDFAQWLDTI